MKRLLSIAMLLAVGTQLFWGSGYLIDYYINTAYYLDRCENSARPELNCDGQCILAQKIKRQESENTKSIASLPLSKEYIVWSIIQDESSPDVCISSTSFGYFNLYQKLVTADIFHPPV